MIEGSELEQTEIKVKVKFAVVCIQTLNVQ